MGAFSDAVRGLERSAPEQSGEFTKGMRSGGNAAMASLNNLAGAVGQKVGADDFAAGRFQTADSYQQDAAASAPRVASMRDIHGVGDAWDYAKGLAGGMVPVGGSAADMAKSMKSYTDYWGPVVKKIGFTAES